MEYCEYCDEKATREGNGLFYCERCAPDDAEPIGCPACGFIPPCQCGGDE